MATYIGIFGLILLSLMLFGSYNSQLNENMELRSKIEVLQEKVSNGGIVAGSEREYIRKSAYYDGFQRGFEEGSEAALRIKCCRKRREE
mgnify:CR=1 FL=1